MIGAGKNGPPRKYERWLSSASSGSVRLAMITDRVWRSFRTENPWVGDSHSVYLSDFSGTGSSLESWRSIREDIRVSSLLRKSGLPLHVLEN
ncbi:hypothetical protein PIB30_034706 [Stylosanthes scabra]|uniref:Uncharacterized protein n=1 Tax=Stylosanthes scabra TaxID=79078 RepID=A0ABU6UCA4_9FABA|nr:hypothetical protein [Stylosanthes scabra]